MTERRDTQSAETTHSVWEALPHAAVRYQTVCSPVPMAWPASQSAKGRGCRRIVLRTSPPAGTMSCAWPASSTAWACPRCTSGTRCWTASTGEGGLGAPPLAYLRRTGPSIGNCILRVQQDLSIREVLLFCWAGAPCCDFFCVGGGAIMGAKPKGEEGGML